MLHDATSNEAPPSSLLRLFGLLALVALALLLFAAWLRAFVATPRAARLRDARWLAAQRSLAAQGR